MQATGYHVFVTDDYVSHAALLEAKHRRKAAVQTGMAEFKSTVTAG